MVQHFRTLENNSFTDGYISNPFSISDSGGFKISKSPIIHSLGSFPKSAIMKYGETGNSSSCRFNLLEHRICKSSEVMPAGRNLVPGKNSAFQSVHDFISKKRDIFLVEYNLSVKRDDLLLLETTASQREDELMHAEKLLEEDATNFDEFLRNTNVLTQQTISSAENCVKERFEKLIYSQKLKSEIILHKTEISRNDDMLIQLQIYELFLTTLSPNGLPISKVMPPSFEEFPSFSVKPNDSDPAFVSSSIPHHYHLKISDKICTLPGYLIDILTSLEENNLSLILNSQEVEEALEDLIHASRFAEDRLLVQVNSLNKEIILLESNIINVRYLANNLEYKAKMFSYGEFKEEDQGFLANIDKKVQNVYIYCIGHNEANIGTLQMLSSIENRVEELFETLDSLTMEKVKNAELARGKQRRLSMREKKIEEERYHQDERMKKSLARSRANPRIVTGRKLLFRSNPPKVQHYEPLSGQRDREEEDHLYFFS